MQDIIDSVEEWLRAGKRVALAVVASTWGSSPRPAGARMGVADSGEICGSVSGGCVESDVVREALESFKDKKPRLLEYGVSDDDAWTVGLSCGGKLTVFVEPLQTGWWKAISEACRKQQPIVSASILSGPQAGVQMTVSGGGQVGWEKSWLDASVRASLLDESRHAITHRRSSRQTVDGRDLFLECLLPQPRLVIVGGAHAAIALESFARELGFRVFLIDPRKAFASRERFPRAERIFHDYPQTVLPELGLDSETYVAVLTHDPKIDDPAMLAALPSPAPYVGVLSSRKTHQKRVARLIKAGLSPDLLERIHTPIGLDIGAATPEEIALAIMAEIVSARRRSQRASS